MTYSSGKLVINGSQYFASTILHEATHAYDFRRGFSRDPSLINARNAEVNVRLIFVYLLYIHNISAFFVSDNGNRN